jgi:hypothetical protein
MTSRSRALTALGAYLCLSAQLIGVIHVLVVRHATCPDHGELTHRVATAAVTPPAQPPADTARGAPPVVEHQDEHCLMLITRRREMAGLTPGGAALALLSPAAAVAAISPTPPFPLPGAVLRLAPKTSPPL